MSTAMKLVPTLTRDEYLKFERQAEFKSELVDGRLVAMAGASLAHNRCNENLSIEVGLKLRGHSCQSYSRDMKVLVERTDAVFYPDLIVVCEPPQVLDRHGDVLLNPTILFEVLSPSTQNHDMGKKFLHYQRIPTLREYVLVDPMQPLVHHYVKQSDGRWELKLLEGVDAVLRLEVAEVDIRLAAIYDRIDFSQA